MSKTILLKKKIEEFDVAAAMLPQIDEPVIAASAAVTKKVIGDGSGIYADYTNKIAFSDLALNLDFIGPSVRDSEYHYWCTSVVYAEEDQKYHMFTSRVPSDIEFGKGWRNACEIAHFVADIPEGPFGEVGTVFDNEDFKQYGWDAASPHNSRITKIDGKYCLLFMIQTPEGDYKNSSTVLAVSDSVNGGWKIIDNGEGKGYTIPAYGNEGQSRETNNADILKVGGKYHIYFRSAISGYAQFYVAISDKLEGPYEIQPEPVTNNTNNNEDLEAFEWNGKYYLLADDNFGSVTGVNAAGILYSSRDGLHFDTADALIGFADLDEYIEVPDGSTNSYGYSDPSHNEYAKHERPCLLMINGVPAYFYAPSGVNIDGNNACMTYVYKVKKLPKYEVSIAENLKNGTLEFAVQDDNEVVDIHTAGGGYQTQDVTIKAVPDEGYMLVPGSIKATDQNGNDIEITDDGKFAMPRGGVAVTADFVVCRNLS